jgi:hypothetical protein
MSELKREDKTVEGCDSSETKLVSESETVGKDECFEQNSGVKCDKVIRTETSDEYNIQQTDVKELLQSGNSLVTKKSELSRKCHSKEAVSSHQHKRKHHRHSRKHLHSETTGAVFEGERVSYLVGQCEAETAHSTDTNGEQRSVQEDDYVLRKLFKKSGESCLKCTDLYWFHVLVSFMLYLISCVKLSDTSETSFRLLPPHEKVFFCCSSGSSVLPHVLLT